MEILDNTPIQKIFFEGFEFFVKRDDLLHKDFSGNKARKLHYFLHNEFKGIDTLISYGSNQSNAMYSMSVLAKMKNWKFEYYTDHVPEFLGKNPIGNYRASLDNGMNLYLDKNSYFSRKSNARSNELFIDEGGALQEAKFGLKILANEILSYIKENDLKDTTIFLPSGTGTTALYLQRTIKELTVLTCACVGSSEYLQQQFEALEPKLEIYPTILPTPRKFHFGKLYKQNYASYLKLLKQTNIEFDLLYDPIGWQTILEYKKEHPNTNIIYIHQGGALGNISMLQRYERKWSSKEVLLEC